MKEILLGTTNPSKVEHFKTFLSGYNVEFYTLQDLNITDEPKEQGQTPEENAIIKAKFYGKYFNSVICNDSGLYFDGLELNDKRQPGLNIRTPNGSKRLNDEESVEFYSKLIRSLGGRVIAYYLDGLAVYNNKHIYSFMDRAYAEQNKFYMVDKPSENRHKGWPLDSLSLNIDDLTYFTDTVNNTFDTENEQIIMNEYRNAVVSFLAKSLELL